MPGSAVPQRSAAYYDRRGDSQPPRGIRRLGRSTGFTLVETMISLLLLMVCLLYGLAVHMQQRRILDRLAAQSDALRALESTLEALRAGALPMVSATLRPPPTEHATGLVVVVDVAPAGVPYLFDVHAQARYLLAGEPRVRALDTLIWSPPP